LKCFAAYGGDRIVVWEVPSADGRAGRGRAGVGMHGNIRFIKAGTSHFETCWDLSRGVHDLNIRFKEVNRSINGGKLGLCLLDVDMHLGHIDWKFWLGLVISLYWIENLWITLLRKKILITWGIEPGDFDVIKRSAPGEENMKNLEDFGVMELTYLGGNVSRGIV
jgi:hypothetical protein